MTPKGYLTLYTPSVKGFTLFPTGHVIGFPQITTAQAPSMHVSSSTSEISLADHSLAPGSLWCLAAPPITPLRDPTALAGYWMGGAIRHIHICFCDNPGVQVQPFKTLLRSTGAMSDREVYPLYQNRCSWSTFCNDKAEKIRSHPIRSTPQVGACGSPFGATTVKKNTNPPRIQPSHGLLSLACTSVQEDEVSSIMQL